MYHQFFLPLHENYLPPFSTIAMDRMFPPHSYEPVSKEEQVVEKDSEAGVVSQHRKTTVYQFVRQNLGAVIVTVLLPVVIFLPITVLAVISQRSSTTSSV